MDGETARALGTALLLVLGGALAIGFCELEAWLSRRPRR